MMGCLRPSASPHVLLHSTPPPSRTSSGSLQTMKSPLRVVHATQRARGARVLRSIISCTAMSQHRSPHLARTLRHSAHTSRTRMPMQHVARRRLGLGQEAGPSCPSPPSGSGQPSAAELAPTWV
jgi:hypothetical protein